MAPSVCTYIAHSQEALVKEEDDPQECEQDSKSRQPDPDLCSIPSPCPFCICVRHKPRISQCKSERERLWSLLCDGLHLLLRSFISNPTMAAPWCSAMRAPIAPNAPNAPKIQTKRALGFRRGSSTHSPRVCSDLPSTTPTAQNALHGWMKHPSLFLMDELPT